MKKRNCKIIMSMLCAAMCLTSNSLMVFADTNANINAGEIINMKSDGNQGMESSGHTNKNTTSNSGSSYHATQAELNANSEKQSALDAIKKWKDLASSMDETKNRQKIGYNINGWDPDILLKGYTAISRDDIQNFLSHIDNFSGYLGQDNVDAFYNSQSESNGTLPKRKLDVKTDIKSLSKDKVKKIKKAIAKNENLYASETMRSLATLDGTGQKFSFEQQSTPYFAISGTSTGGRGFYQGIRSDLLWKGMNDSYNWTGRFQDWQNRFGNTTGNSSGSGSNTSSSNQMEDYADVVYLKDYHIYEVQEDQIDNVDYTSDKRRWSVYKKGEENSGKPIRTSETDNPQHAFEFSSDEAGDYVVVAEQEATYTVSMYVTYDVVEYLVDSKSQNILYYNEKLVSNGKGGSVKVDGEQKTGWVSTGDSFNIHVNDLGAVETNGSATQRVQ